MKIRLAASLMAAAAAFAATAVGGPARAGTLVAADASAPSWTIAPVTDELYRRGRALEAADHVAQALPLYREASAHGDAAASQRLMELYADGAPGLGRDYRVAILYKQRAIAQGALLDPPWRH